MITGLIAEESPSEKGAVKDRCSGIAGDSQKGTENKGQQYDVGSVLESGNLCSI